MKIDDNAACEKKKKPSTFGNFSPPNFKRQTVVKTEGRSAEHYTEASFY